jgi:hypothetical protein
MAVYPTKVFSSFFKKHGEMIPKISVDFKQFLGSRVIKVLALHALSPG